MRAGWCCGWQGARTSTPRSSSNSTTANVFNFDKFPAYDFVVPPSQTLAGASKCRGRHQTRGGVVTLWPVAVVAAGVSNGDAAGGSYVPGKAPPGSLQVNVKDEDAAMFLTLDR